MIEVLASLLGKVDVRRHMTTLFDFTFFLNIDLIR